MQINLYDTASFRYDSLIVSRPNQCVTAILGILFLATLAADAYIVIRNNHASAEQRIQK